MSGELPIGGAAGLRGEGKAVADINSRKILKSGREATEELSQEPKSSFPKLQGSNFIIV